MNAANPYNQRNDGGSCGCAECYRTFAGLRGFDAHRVRLPGLEYDWRCATDAELAAKGYAPNARGWWASTATDARFARTMRTETPAEAPDEAGHDVEGGVG